MGEWCGRQEEVEVVAGGRWNEGSGGKSGWDRSNLEHLDDIRLSNFTAGGLHGIPTVTVNFTLVRPESPMFCE